MFKLSSFENEIMSSMEKSLITNQLEDKHNFNKLVKAAEYLNLAAEIFEKAGMKEESIEIIKILEDFAKQI
jgi:hypothetical protein